MSFLSPEQELVAVVKAMKLQNLIQEAQQPNVHNELRDAATTVVQTIVDLFGMEVPGVINGDPLDTLLQVNREVNPSRMLKERGLFRLFVLVIEVDESGTPLYKSVVNPDTDEQFTTQEEFLGWFCEAAQINRSTVFMHKATVEKLLNAGFDYDEAYKVMMTKPYAIREVLKALGTWNKNNELVSIAPQVAVRLAEKVLPQESDGIRHAAERYTVEETSASMKELTTATLPAIAELIREVGYHDRAGDAIKAVRHDIALVPEITYRWDAEHGLLEITLLRSGVAENGTRYAKDEAVCKFIPETNVPQEILQDLLERLPVKNKHLVL